jgi:hypothetical protein
LEEVIEKEKTTVGKFSIESRIENQEARCKS